MAATNPILRLRPAFRSIGEEPEQADEVADAIDDHSYSRRESDLHFERMMAEMRQAIAQMRTQLVLAIMLATSLIIGAMGLLIALID